MDKQQTSVFSEYQPMSNSSINSKQLQYWLKQVSSPARGGPNFGFEWTFMSNASSRYEPQEISFAKNHTFQSISHEKQNVSNLSNKGTQKQSKNKSYVNAMIALQKKVKTLEDENKYMKKSISVMSDERQRSISDSMTVEQELREKLSILQPKTQKFDEILEQNKKLREIKDEKMRKLKNYEKKHQQLKEENAKLSQKLEQVIKQKEKYENLSESTKKINEKLEQQRRRLFQKNKELEEMKQKSTLTILQKYNKSVQLTEQYERENGRLRKQAQLMKKNHAEEIRKIQEGYHNEIIKCKSQFEKLKQNYDIKESQIEEKKKQVQYFKEAYEKKDGEYTQLAKNQSKLEKFITESRVIQIPQSLNLVQNQAKKSFAGIDSDEEVQFDESQIPILGQMETKSVGKPVTKKQKSSVLSSVSQKRQQKSQNFKRFNEKKTQNLKKRQKSHKLKEQEGQFEEKPNQENSSHSQQSHEKSSQQQCSENYNQSNLIIKKQSKQTTKNNSRKLHDDNNNKRKTKIKNKMNELSKSREKSNSNSRNSKQKSKEKKLEKQRSLSHSQNNTNNNKNDHEKTPKEMSQVRKRSKYDSDHQQYLINSGGSGGYDGYEGSRTQPQHRITFQGDRSLEEEQDMKIANSYYYTSHPPLPRSSGRVGSIYEAQTVQIPQFNQIINNNNNNNHHGCNNKNNNRSNNHTSFDEALLMQLQRQLLDLYEEQQKLILASNDEYSSQSERAEYIGRMKQLNEQLRVKNQKICELKARI